MTPRARSICASVAATSPPPLKPTRFSFSFAASGVVWRSARIWFIRPAATWCVLGRTPPKSLPFHGRARVPGSASWSAAAKSSKAVRSGQMPWRT